MLFHVSHRRSFRWVDPRFQRRYALLLMSVVILVSAILVGTFWFHSEQVLRSLTNSGILSQHKLYLMIQDQMTSLVWSVCIVVALFSALIFVLAIYLSHRIVGPIFAVKRSLEAMGRGDYEGAKMKLRSDDEFQEMADVINAAAEHLGEPE